eukprot:Nitzschia sp. Nitz4//scaffold17_size182527//125253//126008//NITZ4_001868-RA/size182527-processed-gene-0.65-mRNA-1//-1//CDS//3329539382//4336//frame0
MSRSKPKSFVRSTGLAEALWACALDDYLSEEEEGEFSKIIGKKDQSLWGTLQDSNPWVVRETRTEDPREARMRGGGYEHASGDFEPRDGTPAVWDEASASQGAPVTWLDVPPEEMEDPDQAAKTIHHTKQGRVRKGKSSSRSKRSETPQKSARKLGERSRSRGKSCQDSRVSSKGRSRSVARSDVDLESRSQARSTRSRSRPKSRQRSSREKSLTRMDRDHTSSRASTAYERPPRTPQSSLRSRRLNRGQL